MNQDRPFLTRRTVLRGLGVTMCLPLLEAVQPFAAVAAPGTGKKAKPPCAWPCCTCRTA
jgi:hypothetical protein